MGVQSGVRGVSKSGNRWKANIQVDKKKIYLGTFTSIEDAANAYKEAAIKYDKESFLLPKKTKEQKYQDNKEWYSRNKEERKLYNKSYRIDNQANIKKRMRNTRWNIKIEMITAYGGKCECCGESNPEFLSVDHIYGGGNQHRKIIKGGCNFYYMLKKQGWPKDLYRLLCYNCNGSYGYYGYCPHSKNRETECLAHQ